MIFLRSEFLRFVIKSQMSTDESLTGMLCNRPTASRIVSAEFNFICQFYINFKIKYHRFLLV